MTVGRRKGETDHDLGPGFVRRNIDLDIGHVSYLWRPGSAPTLILIPGSFSDSYALLKIIDQLDTQSQLVMMEVRGHGGSWPPPVNGSIERFAQDALRVVDDLKLDSFYIGGHSIGGMIALEAARVCLHNVKGVVSIEGWTNHNVLFNAFRDQTDNTLSPEQAARNEQLRSRVLDHWTPEQADEFRRYWTQWDGYEFLCTTDIPILELYGDRGCARPGRDQLRIPERDNIVVHWIDGASHNLHIEAPGEIARITMDFINTVEGAAS